MFSYATILSAKALFMIGRRELILASGCALSAGGAALDGLVQDGGLVN